MRTVRGGPAVVTSTFGTSASKSVRALVAAATASRSRLRAAAGITADRAVSPARAAAAAPVSSFSFASCSGVVTSIPGSRRPTAASCTSAKNAATE